jgi:hypothetical protein
MLDNIDRKILEVLAEDGGFVALAVARRANLMSGCNGRQQSGAAQSWLKSLEGRGFVAKMDDLKPICWIRTPAGTAAMISLPRGGAKTLVEEMEAYA